MGGEPLAEMRMEDWEAALEGTWRGPDPSVLELDFVVEGPAEDVVSSDILAGGKLVEEKMYDQRSCTTTQIEDVLCLPAGGVVEWLEQRLDHAMQFLLAYLLVGCIVF